VGWIHLAQGVVCSYEHGNVPSGSIKGGRSLDQLSEHSLLKKDSSP